MKLGIDISTYLEEKAAGAKYYEGKKQIDPLKDFIANGVDLIRLRVWNNPYDENGKPYLGGTNDIANDLKIINETKGYGYKYIIDFHYSDFWVDPAKQTLPKSWKNLSFEEILKKVYEFTKESLTKIKETGAEISYVQIGNEITFGILWPYGQLTVGKDGKRQNFENFIAILNAGIKGAREVVPDTKIIIHLEKSNDHKAYEEIFGAIQKANVDYDVIGMSYYPYWHGTMNELFYNIENCRKKFNKNVMIAELGFGFTLEDYLLTNNGLSELKVTKENLEAELEYDITPEGQAGFIEEFIRRSKEAGLEGVCYWEPLWIPGENVCWSSVEGQRYIHEEGKPTRNEWSNQCLFDYSGKKLPAFNKYKL